MFSGTMLVDVKVMPKVRTCSEDSTSDFERGMYYMLQLSSLDTA